VQVLPRDHSRFPGNSGWLTASLHGDNDVSANWEPVEKVWKKIVGRFAEWQGATTK
jgi:hypothetical protein